MLVAVLLAAYASVGNALGSASAGLPSLPPNWVQFQSEYGKPYYYNQVDGRRQWEYPTEETEYQTQGYDSMFSPGQAGGSWYTAQDQNGRTYYVDSYTGSTTYEMPPDFDQYQAVDSSVSEMELGLEDEAEKARRQHQQEQQAAQELVEKLEAAKQQLEEDKEKLSEKLKRVEEELAEVMEQRNKTASELELVRGQREASELQVEGLKANLTVAQNNVTSLTEHLANITSERDGFLEQLTGLKSKREAQAKELEAACQKTEEVEAQYNQALEEIARLEELLRTQSQPDEDDSGDEEEFAAHRSRHRRIDDPGSSEQSLLGRMITSYVRAFVPRALLKPTKEYEVELESLNRVVERLRENSSSLVEVINSRNSLIDELHQRIDLYEAEQLRRRKTVASLREAISELTEDVNLKTEELAALRSELKSLVQELLWRDANITTLESRATLAEARAAGLEAELNMAAQVKGRALETATSLKQRLTKLEIARDEAEKEGQKLREELERHRLEQRGSEGADTSDREDSDAVSTQGDEDQKEGDREEEEGASRKRNWFGHFTG